jgi:hypothetical protein
MSIAGTQTDEPKWLRNLRTALNAAKMSNIKTISVNVSDLENAIGKVEDGPGGTAYICAENGVVIVDYRKLLKAVYLTSEEARNFAEMILKHCDKP